MWECDRAAGYPPGCPADCPAGCPAVCGRATRDPHVNAQRLKRSAKGCTGVGAFERPASSSEAHVLVNANASAIARAGASEVTGGAGLAASRCSAPAA
mmetsp:Transcript_73273/g.203054  ORF Transcript_73273/g.203054 Transcript_73273/m.203054 type:complete len:98 (+) Transcript_73273:340-633(+)